MNTDRPMTPQQAAAQLGIHVNTIKRIHPADLPYFRVGSRGDRRYDPADVRRYRLQRAARRAHVSCCWCGTHHADE